MRFPAVDHSDGSNLSSAVYEFLYDTEKAARTYGTEEEPVPFVLWDQLICFKMEAGREIFHTQEKTRYGTKEELAALANESKFWGCMSSFLKKHRWSVPVLCAVATQPPTSAPTQDWHAFGVCFDPPNDNGIRIVSSNNT